MAKASRDKGKLKNFCACGCGTEIPFISKQRKPQRFAHGHNSRQAVYTVEDRGWVSPCWIFSNGGERYGRIRRDNKQYPAHRYFYELHLGPIPDGMTLDHLCEVKRCVNPSHLEPVTQTENVRRAMPLAQDQVEEIRRVMDEALPAPPRKRRPKGLIPRLAKAYGVDEKTIKNIGARRTWA